MKMKFILSSSIAPGRFLVYLISPRYGERYLGVVWKVRDKCWLNDRSLSQFVTRRAAGAALQ
jgi:hypothetical protein